MIDIPCRKVLKRAGSTGDPRNLPIDPKFDPKFDPKLIQSLKELAKRHLKLSRAALYSELNASERQVRYI